MRLLDPHRTLRRRTSFGERMLLALLLVSSGLGLGHLLPSAAAQPALETKLGLEFGERLPASVQSPTEAPSEDIDRLIMGSLETLIALQESDGRFRVSSDPDTVKQGEHGEVHVTALCLRALHRLGRDERHAAAAARAEAWLLKAQDAATGRIGQPVPHVYVRGHAVALLALAERERSAPQARRRSAIEKAVAFAEAARNPYRAWRFGMKPGDNDSRVTSAMLRALAATKALGIAVPGPALEHGREFLDEMHDEDTGRWGFVSRRDRSTRLATKLADFPGERVEEPTAMVLNCLFEMGETPLRNPSLRQAPNLLMERQPEWSVAGGRIDFSYWHFGTHALECHGGWQELAWDRSVRQSLIPHAEVAEDGKVSWPPIDAWSGPGMRAWATAINALTLDAARPQR